MSAWYDIYTISVTIDSTSDGLTVNEEKIYSTKYDSSIGVSGISHYLSGGIYVPAVITSVHSLGYSYLQGSAGSTVFTSNQGLFVTTGSESCLSVSDALLRLQSTSSPNTPVAFTSQFNFEVKILNFISDTATFLNNLSTAAPQSLARTMTDSLWFTCDLTLTFTPIPTFTGGIDILVGTAFHGFAGDYVLNGSSQCPWRIPDPVATTNHVSTAGPQFTNTQL